MSYQDLLPLVGKLKLKYDSLYVIDLTNLILDNKLAPNQVVIRQLTRGEFNYYIGLFQNNNDIAIQEVNKDCIVYPLDFDLDSDIGNCYKAGIDSYIFKAIVSTSGFSSESLLATAISNYRQYASTLEATITMMICKAFPSYKPKDIDNLTFTEQIKLVCMAEQMLGVEVPYDNWFNPKKSKENPDKGSKIDKQERLRRFREKHNKNLPEPPKGWQSVTATPKENVVTKDNLFKAQKELEAFLNDGT